MKDDFRGIDFGNRDSLKLALRPYLPAEISRALDGGVKTEHPYLVWQLAVSQDKRGTYAWFIVREEDEADVPQEKIPYRPPRWDFKTYSMAKLVKALTVEYIRQRVST
jgi:hypothetical protein